MPTMSQQYPPHIRMEQENIHKNIQYIKDKEFHTRCLQAQLVSMQNAEKEGDKYRELACARAAARHKYALSLIPTYVKQEQLEDLMQQELDLLLPYLADIDVQSDSQTTK